MTKLYRSQRDKKLFGLCGGLAEAINVDATLLRLVVIVTAVFSGGTVILLYVLASLVIPKEPSPFVPNGGFGYGMPGGPGAYGSGPAGGAYPPPPSGSGRSAAPGGAWGAQAGTHGSGLGSTPAGAQPGSLDDLMGDIEKKALRKELEELREKLAQLEKSANSGANGNGSNKQ